MKVKKKKSIFICQITESHLKVTKCVLSNNSKREFLTLEVESISPETDDRKIIATISWVFKKLGYSNNLVIISLPRYQATCRYLRIPSTSENEINKIINLQASRYLPYPANELISGYQIVSTDKEGYSYVNLVIAHKDIVERYVNIFKVLRPGKLVVALSSYGLCNFYNYVAPEETESVMIIDIDTSQIELAIVSNRNLLFSRAFKINKLQPNWENPFIDEINRTQDAYLKGVSKELPRKIIIVGSEKNSQEIINVLKQKTNFSVDFIPYSERINLSKNLLNFVLASDISFISIFGLGLSDIPETLNLLPPSLKEITKRASLRKEYIRLAIFIFSTILIFTAAINKNLDNKLRYLQRLKTELNKISKDAKPLEDIEKRLLLLENRRLKKPSSLEILYGLHQTIPSQISLINFSFEEDNQVILRGQSQQLNNVFAFASQLEKSAVFKNFNIKVRYATQKKTQTGQIVDFEIVCLKK